MHPEFNPFPAFQDLDGMELCQLEKSCLDQQNSLCTKREFGGSEAEKNTAGPFPGNFGRTEWLWVPADSLEGVMARPAHQYKEERGALGTTRGHRGNVISHRVGRWRIMFPCAHIKLTTVSHVALEAKANPLP